MSNKRSAKHVRRNYKTRIAYSFAITYMIIALIPILIGTLFYSYTLRVVSDNEYDKTRAMLAQSVEVMDSDMQLIKEIMRQIVSLDSVNSLMCCLPPSSDVNAVVDSIEVKADLKQIFMGNSMIYDVLIYMSTPQMLFDIDSSYCFTRHYVYYPYFFEMEGVSREDWQRILISQRSGFYESAYSAIIRDNNTGRKDSLEIGLYVWPLYTDGVWRGSVIYMLNATKFIERMSQTIDVEAGAMAWIETEDGTRIMSCPANDGQADELSTDTSDADDMFKVSISSRSSKLKYCIMVPNAVVYGKVRWLRDSIILTVMLSVALGVTAALLFSRWLGAPLDRISFNLKQLYALDSTHERIEKRMPRISPVEQLGNNVNELIIKHSQLRHYVSRQINVIDQLFYEKLLSGAFDDEEQITSMLEHISQRRLASPFLLAIVKFERIGSELNVNEASEISACRATAFETELLAESNMFETSLDRCVLIFSLDQYLPAEVEAQLNAGLNRMISELPRTLDIRIVAAVSVPVSGYMELSRVYSRCTELLYGYGVPQGVVAFEDNRPVIAYQRDMSAAQQSYDYTLDIENQLINFTVAGNRDKVHEIIQDLFGEDHDAGDHFSRARRLLVQGLCATLLRIGRMLGDSVVQCLQKLDDATLITSGSVAQALDSMLGFYDSIIDIVQLKLRSRTDGLIANVRSYIEENYADPDMTLSSTAEHFTLTDTYPMSFS